MCLASGDTVVLERSSHHIQSAAGMLCSTAAQHACEELGQADQHLMHHSSHKLGPPRVLVTARLQSSNALYYTRMKSVSKLAMHHVTSCHYDNAMA